MRLMQVFRSKRSIMVLPLAYIAEKSRISLESKYKKASAKQSGLPENLANAFLKDTTASHPRKYAETALQDDLMLRSTNATPPIN